MNQIETVELGPVKTWSYSALKVFEECPQRTYLSRVEKQPEKSSAALDRGNAIHTLAEDYVQGVIDEMPKELKNHKKDFERLRQLYADGIVEVEGDWAVDLEWQPTGWFDDDCWGRIKLDVFVREDETSARVIDHKTGKKYPIPHTSQAQQYCIASFLRYPELQFIQAEFWYLDIKDETQHKLIKSYTRDQAMLFLPKLNERALAMTTCKEFLPKPSKYTCKWCPHNSEGNGSCGWSEV